MTERIAGNAEAEPAGQTLRDLVGDAVWTDLVADAVERRHPVGSVLLRQGEPGTHVLAVLGGVAKVLRHERNGDVTLLAFRGPGELLGEVAVLDDGVRLATVEALTECSVAVLSKAEFTRFASRYELFPVLVRYALTRLRESDEARGGGDVLARLAATLVRLADISRDTGRRSGEPLELALTRNELAQYLRTSRNTVTAKLAELEPGTVRAHRMRVVVEDLDALRRTAAALADG
ncbi:Crp/Fnr family transcriptional regulator [Streptomyces daliensis]|uniref:Crp/Fnr family transcriptional regulator n=1 Tax=Streptomyces daliensis TaxID=299421 RepID=A0A8T4J3Z0_9ACTN|nr:Crp/Fnr family transcriptional regulator [Streptomyces daliensis]